MGGDKLSVVDVPGTLTIFERDPPSGLLKAKLIADSTLDPHNLRAKFSNLRIKRLKGSTSYFVYALGSSARSRVF